MIMISGIPAAEFEKHIIPLETGNRKNSVFWTVVGDIVNCVDRIEMAKN